MKTSLYIHIPYCFSKCDYCDFFSVGCGKRSVPEEYITALCNEITYKIKEHSVQYWNTVYIGGGTPSLLSQSQLEKLFNAVLSTKQDSISECTIEVNPDDITEEYIQILNELPVTRISCGIQSLQNNVLKNVNRRSDQNSVYNALACINSQWKGDFSVDIISGLPEQTLETFISDLEKLLTYDIDHISMYSLTIEEGTPLYNKISSNQIKYDFDYADSLWLKGRDFLEQNGYNQYEVSNFSKPGKECRHNLVYWNLNNYIGCGAGATGTIYGINNSLRKTNKRDLKAYIDSWKNNQQCPQEIEVIDKETERFEFLMMGLRTLNGINSKIYLNRFKNDIPEDIVNKFKKWQQNNLAEINTLSDGSVQYSLNKQGILLLNSFIIE
ncbi:MAG: radical SAM family heme chaperone HemW [Treponema sp.]|nr:radical SAM family heme chaperone HemW [Treponema sp.]